MYSNWAMQGMMIRQQQERLEAAVRRRVARDRVPARRRRERWPAGLGLRVTLRPSPAAPMAPAGPSGGGGRG